VACEIVLAFFGEYAALIPVLPWRLGVALRNTTTKKAERPKPCQQKSNTKF